MTPPLLHRYLSFVKILFCGTQQNATAKMISKPVVLIKNKMILKVAFAGFATSTYLPSTEQSVYFF